MKNKKAQSGMMWLVVVIVALLIFLLIYSGTWTKLFGKSTSGIKEKMESAGDYDKDSVINAIDKCPCFAGVAENDGCQAGYRITGTNTGNEIKECPKII